MFNLLHKIIRKRAKECGITVAQGEEVYNVVFGRFFRHMCSQIDYKDLDTFKSYRIQGFGVFYPLKSKAKKITENNKYLNETSTLE